MPEKAAKMQRELALTQECCGVDIMEKVRALSHGRVRVGPGTLYAMLGKFEENHVIRRTASEGRRKFYIITEAGKQMLLKEYQRLKVMVEDGEQLAGELHRNDGEKRGELHRNDGEKRGGLRRNDGEKEVSEKY